MASALRFMTCLILTACIVASAEAAINCNMVASSFAPCFNYLTKGGMVPPSCCASLTSLNNMANTTPDRQQACRCLKTLAKSYARNIQPTSASSIGGKCGINVPYAIAFSTNCNSVK